LCIESIDGITNGYDYSTLDELLQAYVTHSL